MIRDNLASVRERINIACSGCRRNPAEIAIVAVTKGRSAAEIQEAIESGISYIGENRVQEAMAKFYELQAKNCGLRWHMVGHLQTNKTKDAVEIFDLIHSVDSLRLAEEINKQASRISKVQNILIEVNVSGEASKFGVRPEELISIVEKSAGFKNINVQGLMTIAPAVDKAEEARPYFRALRELRDKIYERRTTNDEPRILSMGMTDDFEIAIEEGSSMIRLGRAIFDA